MISANFELTTDSTTAQKLCRSQAFFSAKTLVGCIGGSTRRCPPPFWLHAAYALGSGHCFVAFKFIAATIWKAQPALKLMRRAEDSKSRKHRKMILIRERFMATIRDNRQLILIVEDIKQTADDLCSIISRKMGVRVQVAYDGGRAVEIASTEHPDLILLDIDLPVLHGFEVLEELKRRNVATRVFMLSGFYVDSDTAIKAIKAGACDYLRKPVNLRTLIDRIKKALITEATLNVQMQLLVAPFVLELFKSVERAAARGHDAISEDRAGKRAAELYQPTLRQSVENNLGLLLVGTAATAFLAGAMAVLAFLDVLLPNWGSTSTQGAEAASPIRTVQQVATPTASTSGPADRALLPSPSESLTVPLPYAIAESGMTLEQAEANYDSLLRRKDPAAEQFVKQASGHRIHWRVVVERIMPGGDSVAVTFRSPTGTPVRLFHVAQFPTTFKKRLFELPEGAVINIHGVIQSLERTGEYSVAAYSFERD